MQTQDQGRHPEREDDQRVPHGVGEPLLERTQLLVEADLLPVTAAERQSADRPDQRQQDDHRAIAAERSAAFAEPAARPQQQRGHPDSGDHQYGQRRLPAAYSPT
ncbi:MULTISPECIES: hypothetical protein [unclassified Streptomyces]|uniref:hypothetical protein n=1 Tax=unclassified Streptomyces TaxID=2593676 RepID=UPI001F2F3247|nr:MULTISPECIES: hypothetical protein [unclassified Streptomyces]